MGIKWLSLLWRAVFLRNYAHLLSYLFVKHPKVVLWIKTSQQLGTAQLLASTPSGMGRRTGGGVKLVG